MRAAGQDTLSPAIGDLHADRIRAELGDAPEGFGFGNFFYTRELSIQ